MRAGIIDPRLSHVRLVSLPKHSDANGDLVVVEALAHVPLAIARVFFVMAQDGALRGQHAHKECSQFFSCPRGSIEVFCDDGEETATWVLDRPEVGLLVPPGIWSQQRYVTPGSVLAVLCDRPYDAADYIRDYDQFRAYRQALKSRP